MPESENAGTSNPERWHEADVVHPDLVAPLLHMLGPRLALLIHGVLPQAADDVGHLFHGSNKLPPALGHLRNVARAPPWVIAPSIGPSPKTKGCGKDPHV
jgi:hypothetical protein